MLSERSLEYLTRPTPLRQHLVRLAWPNLITESKLQLIELVKSERDGNSFFNRKRTGSSFVVTPHWLVELALEDEAPIVRYWASRDFEFIGSDDSDNPWVYDGDATDADRALYTSARKDSAPLVRAFCDCNHDSGYTTLFSQTQLARLNFFRNAASPGDLAWFVTWLDGGHNEGIPDVELAECAEEYFSRLETLEVLEHPATSSIGTDAANAEVLTLGWALAKKSKPPLQDLLARVLPTSLGNQRVDIEELSSMPSEVSMWFGSRVFSSSEIDEWQERNPLKTGWHPHRSGFDNL